MRNEKLVVVFWFLVWAGMLIYLIFKYFEL